MVRICQREALRNERLHRIGFYWEGRILSQNLFSQQTCSSGSIIAGADLQNVFPRRWIAEILVFSCINPINALMGVHNQCSVLSSHGQCIKVFGWHRQLSMSILKSDKVIAEKLRRFSRIRLAETWEQQWTEILDSCNNPNRHKQRKLGHNRSIRKWRELLRMNISLRRECWSISLILASLRITAYSQLYVNICHYVIGVYAHTCLPWK